MSSQVKTVKVKLNFTRKREEKARRDFLGVWEKGTNAPENLPQEQENSTTDPKADKVEKLLHTVPALRVIKTKFGNNEKKISRDLSSMSELRAQ